MAAPLTCACVRVIDDTWEGRLQRVLGAIDDEYELAQRRLTYYLTEHEYRRKILASVECAHSETERSKRYGEG